MYVCWSLIYLEILTIKDNGTAFYYLWRKFCTNLTKPSLLNNYNYPVWSEMYCWIRPQLENRNLFVFEELWDSQKAFWCIWHSLKSGPEEKSLKEGQKNSLWQKVLTVNLAAFLQLAWIKPIKPSGLVIHSFHFIWHVCPYCPY